MFERIVAALESIAVSLKEMSHTTVIDITGNAATAPAPLTLESAAAPAPKKRGRPAAVVTAAPSVVVTNVPVATSDSGPVVSAGVPAPLASVPITRETVRAALIAYSNKTSQDATLALLEKVTGTKVMSKVPEYKFQAVLDALAGATPAPVAAAPSPFNS